jgi:hypothetical protein
VPTSRPTGCRWLPTPSRRSLAVRVGIDLRDFGNFPELNAIYREFFGEADLPARTTLPVAFNGLGDRDRRGALHRLTGTARV